MTRGVLATAFSGKLDAGEAGARSEEPFLYGWVVRVRMGLEGALMVEVLARDLGGWIVADGQPGLGDRGFGHIVGCAWSSIFVGTHPGSRAFDKTEDQRRATAKARMTSNSLESAYACEPFQLRRSHCRSERSGSPPDACPSSGRRGDQAE